MECFADSMGITHKADISRCKIVVPCNCPKRRSVALDYYGLLFQDPLNYLVGSLLTVNSQRYITLVVSMAGTYDRHGEVLFLVLSHKELFACDLIS